MEPNEAAGKRWFFVGLLALLFAWVLTGAAFIAMGLAAHGIAWLFMIGWNIF